MFLEAVTYTIASWITELTTAGGTLLNLVPDIGDVIMQTPVLAAGFVVWGVGAVFGLFGRGMRRG